MRYTAGHMGGWRDILFLLTGVWAACAPSPLKADETSQLAHLCPALLANMAPSASLNEVESTLRVGMAWPEKGPLTGAQLPSRGDGIPTYTVRSGTAPAVVVRVALPGQPVAGIAAERRAAQLGYDHDLGPRPISVNRDDVLVVADLPGDLVEKMRPTPVKAIAAAIRKVGALPTKDLEPRDVVADLLAAVERNAVALGSNATTLRQGLGKASLALRADGAPKRVPCLRRIAPDSVYFDGDAVRFAQWKHLAVADPFEDFAQLANLIDLRLEDEKDFLGKLLHREPTRSDFARLAVYRTLATTVPNAETATAENLLPLVRLMGTADWVDWVRDLPSVPR